MVEGTVNELPPGIAKIIKEAGTIRYSIDVSYVFLSYFFQARRYMYDKALYSEFQCFLVLLLAVARLPNSLDAFPKGYADELRGIAKVIQFP